MFKRLQVFSVNGLATQKAHYHVSSLVTPRWPYLMELGSRFLGSTFSKLSAESAAFNENPVGAYFSHQKALKL